MHRGTPRLVVVTALAATFVACNGEALEYVSRSEQGCMRPTEALGPFNCINLAHGYLHKPGSLAAEVLPFDRQRAHDALMQGCRLLWEHPPYHQSDRACHILIDENLAVGPEEVAVLAKLCDTDPPKEGGHDHDHNSDHYCAELDRAARQGGNAAEVNHAQARLAAIAKYHRDEAAEEFPQRRSQSKGLPSQVDH